MPDMSQGAGPSVARDKQTLRRRLRAQRRSLAQQRDRAADATMIVAAVSALLDGFAAPPSRIGEHPSYDDQPCVAIYRSLSTEPPTEALAENLQRREARVIVPEMLHDKDLDWHELRADGSEGPGLGLEGIAAAHVILVPALAVDRSGTRLGQGGGSYDRALARRHPDALIAAVVNDDEYVAWTLPRDAHDVPVNAVITPGRGLNPIPGSGSVS
jgi:5-formyltetrahydrofolate cyclo-ligase